MAALTPGPGTLNAACFSPSDDQLAQLRRRSENVSAYDLLETMIKREFPEKIALVSSFGAEAVVLLHMASQIDPLVPVIFLNTGKLFPETLRYRDLLQERLGLADMRVVAPHPDDRSRRDPDGTLWSRDADACCFFRKTLPLARALKGFSASITGRKRFQTRARTEMPRIELLPTDQNGKSLFRINPLARWDLAQIAQYAEKHRLPKHPLIKENYLSIGCMPCTSRLKPGQNYRAGRWSGSEKEECGIHAPAFQDGDGI